MYTLKILASERKKERKRTFPSNEFDYENGFDKNERKKIESDSSVLHHWEQTRLSELYESEWWNITKAC